MAYFYRHDFERAHLVGSLDILLTEVSISSVVTMDERMHTYFTHTVLKNNDFAEVGLKTLANPIGKP